MYIITIVTPIYAIAGGWNWIDYNYSSDDILEYHPENDTITTVGHMIQARNGHAVSVVQADDYLPWCQWEIGFLGFNIFNDY